MELRSFHAKVIDEFRANEGVVEGMPPLLLLTTTGARSGKQRTSPLNYLVNDGHYYINGGFSGAPHHPAWFHNLIANPNVTIEVGSKTLDVVARVLTDDERQRIFECFVRSKPAPLQEWQDGIEREIPIIELTHAEQPGSAAAQAALWGQRASDWAELEEGNRPLFEAVLDEVGLSSGAHLLDAGCGAGVACRIARERGARVVGLDATPELIEIARSQVPEGEFHVGDLEYLPFESDSFDVVTVFNAVQYAANPVNALQEARRVVRPGGYVAMAVLASMPVPAEAIQALLPPPPPGAADPLALSNFEALAALARDAGLHPVSEGHVTGPKIYADKEEVVRLFLSAGPITRALSIVGEAAVRSAIADILPPFRQADGTYRLDHEFMYIITTVRRSASRGQRCIGISR